MDQSSNFSTSSTNTYFLDFCLFVYNDSYPNECEGLPHCDLDVHFRDVRGSRQGNDQKCAVRFSGNEVCREDLEVTRTS